MSDKIYTNKELIEKYRQCPEIIFKMWQESEFQKVSYQKEIIILKKGLAYWREEAEKFEKLFNEKLRKNHFQKEIAKVIKECLPPKRTALDYNKNPSAIDDISANNFNICRQKFLNNLKEKFNINL